MPWKERTAMSQREEFVQAALKANANIRALCREYGITAKTGYKLKDCQEKFDAWRTLYNSRRPHQALDMHPPATHYQPSLRLFTGQFPPIEYEPDDILRTTDIHGRIQFHARRFHVGKAFRKSQVALRPTTMDGLFNVFFFKQRIAQISLRTDNP